MTNERAAERPKLAYSVEEASHASGVGRTKLYEAIQLGKLQSIKVGSRRLILVDKLKAWLVSHETA